MSGSLKAEQARIYAAFSESPQIRLAVETWQTSVLAAGFDAPKSVAVDQVRYLLNDVIRQLVLCGFAVIVGGAVDSDALISWDDQEKAWRADVDDDVDVAVCIFMPPARLGDRTVMSSFGAAAVTVWDKLNRIEHNMLLRDSLNSSRSVYTVVNPNISPGDALAPSFIAARSNPNATADADYTTSIRRHELLRELAQHTEAARENDMSAQLVAGGGFPVDTRVKRHDELFVTDGMAIGNEARHLNGPVSDMNRLLRTYDHDLLMATGVPPQKLGMNVNSERLAGSEFISSQAIRNFEGRVRDIRVTVNETLQPMKVIVRPAISYNILVHHADLFAPEKHRELLADSLGIPLDFLADDAMDVAQEADDGISGGAKEAKEDVDPGVV